jgi:hypothetical protein
MEITVGPNGDKLSTDHWQGRTRQNNNKKNTYNDKQVNDTNAL